MLDIKDFGISKLEFIFLNMVEVVTVILNNRAARILVASVGILLLVLLMYHDHLSNKPIRVELTRLDVDELDTEVMKWIDSLSDKDMGVYLARRVSSSEEEYFLYFCKLNLKGMSVGTTNDRQGLSIRISELTLEGSEVFSITCRDKIPLYIEIKDCQPIRDIDDKTVTVGDLPLIPSPY